jgi:hypothetical protein
MNDALDFDDDHDEEPEVTLASVNSQTAAVVSKGDSPAYRAEAICALLEREIGVEKLLTL